MASSNRHWPSMFKSKPHHLQHDINSSLLSSPACRASPYSSVAGCEERSPEPKPRWNPKPEQIRILEAIFNSGMVNPPRDEIRKIRAQLQEYGQVGDANVFYWFQNRKSRSKHKNRHLQTAKNLSATTTAIAPSSSSSSSSEKSSPKGSSNNNNNNNKALKIASSSSSSAAALTNTNNILVDQISDSPTASVNQTYFQAQNEYFQEPFFFPVQQSCTGASVGAGFTQGFCFSDLMMANNGVHDNGHQGFSGLLLGEMIGGGGGGGSKCREDEEKLKFQQELSFFMTNPTVTNTITPTTTKTDPASVPSLPAAIQGVGETGCGLVGPPNGSGKSTVFINDVAFEVPVGPFNVRDAFGDDAVLLHPSGNPVLTNEWGFSLQPLEDGALYYLMRTLASPPFLGKHDAASDLLAPEFPYQI